MSVQKKIAKQEKILNNLLPERTDVIRGLNLALYSGNNLMLLGAPGVAKSLVVNLWASSIKDAKKFSWLMTKFTTPEEILGPYSIPALKEGRYTRVYKGKLPDAHICFLDEIWKSNSGILNTTLTLLNERVFFDDGIAKPTDTYLVIGASNELPEDSEGLNAVRDRFSLKFIVRPLQEMDSFMKVMKTNMPSKLEDIITLEEIQKARAAVENVEMVNTDLFVQLKKALNVEGFNESVRTYKNAIKVLKAQAFLEGRNYTIDEDFDVLQHVLWQDPEHRRKVYSIILEVINPVKNQALEIFDSVMVSYNEALAQKTNQEKAAKAIQATENLRIAKDKLEELSIKESNSFYPEYKSMLNKIGESLDTLFFIVTKRKKEK